MPIVLAALLSLAATAEDPRAFSVASADGHVINGEVDAAEGEPRGVVVMVAGTGAFDRDVTLGRTGTARDKLDRCEPGGDRRDERLSGDGMAPRGKWGFGLEGIFPLARCAHRDWLQRAVEAQHSSARSVEHEKPPATVGNHVHDRAGQQRAKPMDAGLAA